MSLSVALLESAVPEMYRVAWIQHSVCVSVYIMYYITTAASPAERAPAAAVAPGLLEPSPPGI